MSAPHETQAAKTPPRGSAGGAAPILPIWLGLAAVAVVLGVSAFGVSQVRVVTDITALLPAAGERGADSPVELARQAGLMRRVAIVIGPEPAGSERLFQGADAVSAAVAGLDGVSEVFGRIDAAGGRRAAELLMSRGMRLYRPAATRFDADEIRRRLADLKQRLAAPEALVIQQYLLADPLGFARVALRGLEGSAEGLGAVVERGRLLSADGRHVLLFAEIDFDPLDVERAAGFAGELDERIDEALSDAGLADLEVVTLGGVHFAAASADTMMRDVRLAFAITAVGVLLVFALFLGRLRLLPAALVPGGVGIGVALGVMGYAAVELHALTLGFAAAITGISVDYAIHLLHRALHRAGDDTRERMRGAIRAIVRPVVLGCATTVIAFVIVAFSGFPGMRQLAVFSAISVPVALAVALLLLPAFHRILLGGNQPGPGIGGRVATGLALLAAGPVRPSRRALIVCAFAAVTAVAAWGGAVAPRSGDPRDMGYEDPDLAGRRSRLESLFPGLTGQTVITAGGTSREQALQANDELYDALLADGFDVGSIFSVSPFLPSHARQRRSLRAAEQLLGDRQTGQLFVAAGFSPAYFQGLAQGLDAAPLEPADFTDTGLGRLVTESVRQSAGGWQVLTRVLAPGDEQLDRLAAVVERVGGCAVVSERLQARRALLAMQRELALMLGIWLVVALLLVSVVLRSPLSGLRAVLPAVVGVASAAGLFGLLDRPLTPVAAAGLTLVMGLGIDYGIFMLGRNERALREAAPAVLASALTTLAAFGALSFALTRAMADLGLIILVGVGAAVLAALLLVPAAAPRRSGDEVAR